MTEKTPPADTTVTAFTGKVVRDVAPAPDTPIHRLAKVEDATGRHNVIFDGPIADAAAAAQEQLAPKPAKRSMEQEPLGKLGALDRPLVGQVFVESIEGDDATGQIQSTRPSDREILNRMFIERNGDDPFSHDG